MASHPKRAHMDNVPDTPDQTESSSENDSASDDESNDLEREIQVRTESIMTQLWKNISLRQVNDSSMMISIKFNFYQHTSDLCSLTEEC